MYSIARDVLNDYMPNLKNGGYVQFNSLHLETFTGLDDYGIAQVPPQIRKQRIIHQSKCGPTITAYVNDRPVAIFGCVIVWDGLGEAWALFSEEARRYPIAMTKGAHAFFDICEILFTLHRIQITVRSEDERAMAWARCLHFEKEGLLKQYSVDKKDYYMMRRT
jgi:hypothetical protein